MATFSFPMLINEYGVWHYRTDSEKDLITEIPKDSDRAAAIIAASLFEARLQEAIKFRMQRDPKIEERLFQPSGPLGAFSTKIDLAYMIGLISKAAHADAIHIKDIRNPFAHKLDVKNFKTNKIADKAKNLQLINSLIALREDRKGGWVFTMDPTKKPRMGIPDYNNARNDPKKRYLATIALFSFSLLYSEIPEHKPPFI